MQFFYVGGLGYYHHYSHHRSKYRLIDNFCHLFFLFNIFYTSQCVLKTAIRVFVKTKGHQRKQRGVEGDGRGTWMMVVVVLMSGVTLGPHERVTGWKRGGRWHSLMRGCEGGEKTSSQLALQSSRKRKKHFMLSSSFLSLVRHLWKDCRPVIWEVWGALTSAGFSLRTQRDGGGNQPGRDRDGGEHMDGRFLTFCSVKSRQKKNHKN